jgi:putative hydroxymethylpyrimidine transport system ATP-binding protein
VGKTTLLRIIANLVPDQTEFSGDISNSNELPLSQQISYMAQTDLLMPWLNALENTLISIRLKKQPNNHEIEKAKHLLDRVGLKNAMKKYTQELSGGMRQRVALVRTLLQDQPVILMDEPFSALDAVTRFQLQTLTADFLKNRTVLLVTHDPMEALRLGDEIYVLSGAPAFLSDPIQLHSPIPRDPADAELVRYQAELFHALTKAKEVSE